MTTGMQSADAYLAARLKLTRVGATDDVAFHRP